jgi:hypothetical protein
VVTVETFCPANSTETFSPSAAVPHTGIRLSRCNTALSLNRLFSRTPASAVDAKALAIKNARTEVDSFLKSINRCRLQRGLIFTVDDYQERWNLRLAPQMDGFKPAAKLKIGKRRRGVAGTPTVVRLRPHNKLQRPAGGNFLKSNPCAVQRFAIQGRGLDVMF